MLFKNYHKNTYSHMNPFIPKSICVWIRHKKSFSNHIIVLPRVTHSHFLLHIAWLFTHRRTHLPHFPKTLSPTIWSIWSLTRKPLLFAFSRGMNDFRCSIDLVTSGRRHSSLRSGCNCINIAALQPVTFGISHSDPDVTTLALQNHNQLHPGCAIPYTDPDVTALTL